MGNRDHGLYPVYVCGFDVFPRFQRNREENGRQDGLSVIRSDIYDASHYFGLILFFPYLSGKSFLCLEQVEVFTHKPAGESEREERF